jgi:uncharacterized protein (DUF1015 family)
MLRVHPFTAYRPRPDRARDVASVPYDVVDRAESRALGEGKPDNFIHVVRPDADLPDSVGPYDDKVYAKARENLQGLIARGVMVRDDARRMYLYRQAGTIAGKRQSQTGILLCCDVADYDADRIKKHEKTRPDKEDDRVRSILELGAHAEPVFLAFRPHDGLRRVIDAATKQKPLYDLTTDDGVQHTVWTLDDYKPVVDAFKSMPCCYVADGHHRCAASSRAGAERRKANPKHTGDEEYNRFMAVLFPSDDLLILPYHRVVSELAGLTAQQFLDKVARVCTITPARDPNPPKPGSFTLYLNDGKGWRLCAFAPKLADQSDPVRRLDVALLTEHVLDPILGIRDIRTDKRIDFVGGIRGPGELEKRVNSGKAAAAFCMHPTTMDQLLDVADAGLMMPPKSTWFEPKLRSGLLVHMLD